MIKIRVTITSCFLSMLSACGGGNSQEGSPTLFESDVFAKPSGPLCSVRRTDPILRLEYCVEPTASSASPRQLLQALTNPNHPYIEFTGSGIRLKAELNSFLYEGLQQKHILLHADRVHDGEKFYDYRSSISDDHTRAYAASPTGMMMLNRDSDPQIFQVAQHTSVSPPVPGGWFDQSLWISLVGMRTDWLTAPTERTVRFHGHAVVSAGDGHHLPETLPSGDSTSLTRGQCPIEMELDTKSGHLKLINSPVTCVDAETGAQMTLAISDLGLRSEGSVVRVGVSDSAVMASLMSAPHEVMVAETIHDISGGVYGERAQVVAVRGISSKAHVVLVARRMDGANP
jgi:hypothetical protein